MAGATAHPQPSAATIRRWPSELKSCVEPLAKALGAPIFMPLDVATPGMLELRDKQPSQELATPEQIGWLTLLICSEAGAQIRGAALPIDGGWVAR